MNARRGLLVLVAVVVIALAVYWFARRGGDPQPATTRPASATAPTSSAKSASEEMRDPRTPRRLGSGRGSADRTAMLDAIAKARSRRTAAPVGEPHATTATASGSTETTLDIVDRTGDTSEWEKRTLGTLNSLLGQCYDLGHAEDPALAGTVTLRFTLVGEPGVGGLLERVEILDAGTSITQQTIRDCISQQLYALEVDPPPEGVTVERELSLKFP